MFFYFFIFSILIFFGSSDRDTWEHGMILISRVRERNDIKNKKICLEGEKRGRQKGGENERMGREFLERVGFFWRETRVLGGSIYLERVVFHFS